MMKRSIRNLHSFNPHSALRASLFRNLQSAIRNQGGFSLLWLLILLPAVLLLFLGVQSRLQMTMAATQRGEDRAQARLLAESALLMLQDDLKTKGLGGWTDRAMPMGEISGKGVYQVSILDLDSTATARRVVALGRAGGRLGQVTCELQAAVGATTPAAPLLRVTAVKYRFEAAKE